MSFANQALAAEHVVQHARSSTKDVHRIRGSWTRERQAELAAMGVAIDTLTPEQQKYLASWRWGPEREPDQGSGRAFWDSIARPTRRWSSSQEQEGSACCRFGSARRGERYRHGAGRVVKFGAARRIVCLSQGDDDLRQSAPMARDHCEEIYG